MLQEKMTPDEELLSMVSKFICPGCVCGSSTESCENGKNVRTENGKGWCMSHVLGTSLFGVGRFALGLPPGFCRPSENSNVLEISCFLEWPEASAYEYDPLNIPVWYLEQNGYTYVRIISPRIAKITTHVIKGSHGNRLKQHWPGIFDAGNTPELAGIE